MPGDIPRWALREASPGDQRVARDSQGRGTLQVTWPEDKALRAWAKRHGWPTPWFGFHESFLTRMLGSAASFELALRASGVGLRVPVEEHTISADRLRELDALYEERLDTGRPAVWGSLVEELREIRRAVEAGIVVTVEGAAGPLRTWQEFYDWAHGRYHMLEDGYDKWIGNDD